LWVIIGTPSAVEDPHTAVTRSGGRCCGCGSRSGVCRRRCRWAGRDSWTWGGTRRKDEIALIIAKYVFAAVVFAAIARSGGMWTPSLCACTIYVTNWSVGIIPPLAARR